MAHFPAILVGGPPHSGKSVLVYRLTQALRKRKVDHYVLRACPDGEGDWSQEASPETVRVLRAKMPFTPEFVQAMCLDLQRRHLPLLVDMGGRPTPEQEAILEHCTHAILLGPDAQALAWWRERAERYSLVILAELHSSLTEPETLWDPGPPLRGRIHGLERHRRAPGSPQEAPVFWDLVERVASLFQAVAQDARKLHLRSAPAELTVDLDRLLHTWRPGAASRWQPSDLPAFQSYLPRGEPLALYGRGPLWLFAAGAAHIFPAPFYQFDPRLGWVEALPLTPAPDRDLEARTDLLWQVTEGPTWTHMTLHLPHSYIDYAQLRDAKLPRLPTGHGTILSGKLPLWIYTGLVRAYHDLPWIAVAYPPQEVAVVVHSQDPAHPVGHTLPLPSLS